KLLARPRSPGPVRRHETERCWPGRRRRGAAFFYRTQKRLHREVGEMSRDALRIGFMVAVLSCASALAMPTRVAGTRVTLDPPKSFSVAQQFPGFGRQEIGASIMVTEIPDSVGNVRKGMTKEALASKGMTLIESRTKEIGGKEALLLKVAQTVSGTEFLKLIVIAEDAETSTIVT